MRALLLLLLAASPAWADRWLESSPRTRMKGPDDARAMANPPLGDESDAVVGWELPKANAVLLVQRSVLDGSCADWTAQESAQFRKFVRDDAGATMRYAVDAEPTRMIAYGEQLTNGTWVPTAIYSACVGPEAFVISASSHAAASKRVSREMRQLAVASGATIEAHGQPPATMAIPYGDKHTVDVPAPAYPKRRSAPGMTMFSVPGTATFATLPETYTGPCGAYLDQVLKNYTAEQRTQSPDEALQAVLVERTGDIVWRIGRQHASKGIHAGEYYANITASSCVHGVAGSLLAISFDGASTQPVLSPAVVKRLRDVLVGAFATLR